MAAPQAPPRFGIWALVHGSRAALQDPAEPFDSSWARNQRVVQRAESLGYETVLLAQHTVNPYSDTLGELEAWTASAALAATTTRIEIIAAIKPLLTHPVVLAKMALQIEEISGGRFALNLVNAWNRAELEQAGIPFPPHDARYAYGAEWIEVVEPLLRGERVSHRGTHFQVEDYVLRPASPTRARPALYIGGESEPARALAARHADVWFLNAQPLDSAQAMIADAAARDRRGAPPLRFGMSAFVIARATEADAHAARDRLAALAALDAPMRAASAARTDSAVAMRGRMSGSSAQAIGTNGGIGAGLVGDYETVARRIEAFHAAGVTTFLLQFQPFEAEMERFMAEVRPRLRGTAAA